jgi:Ca-activated chloride channel homolog
MKVTSLRPMHHRFSRVLLCLLLFLSATTSILGATSGSEIKITTKLSQNKLVQYGNNTVYVDVTLSPGIVPDRPMPKRATDLIILLDRSGSMSEARKMPYAKAAIWDVIGRLQPNDRFALVSFSDQAIVQSPLVNVTTGNRHYLNNMVSQVIPAGGTNMGDGLNAALNLLESSYGGRARKILLLSDGQANQGITHPDQLAGLASRATHYGAVLSTIGMGLGFNETLMAKLADHGMGHYSYLEDLSGLANILSRDLEDSRRIFANSSTLEVILPDGVQLLDAGGYPIKPSSGRSSVTIATGQMLSNTPKQFVMTFSVPNTTTGRQRLADIQLNYQVDGQQYQSAANRDALSIAILPPEQKVEANESIDKDVYQRSWMENNLGRMKKKLSQWVKEGKKEQAKQTINSYREEARKAQAASEVPLVTEKMDDALQQLESEVDEAFSGNLHDQQVKQNRAAKSLQYDAIQKQRK